MVANPGPVVICPICHRMNATTVQYAGVTICREHVADLPPADRPTAGICAGEGGHAAAETWLTPNDSRRWCRKHYAEVIRRAVLGAPHVQNRGTRRRP